MADRLSAQAAVAGLLVALCAVYSAWALMPSAWRRALAWRGLRLAPDWAWLQRAARAPGACGGCDNCGDARGKAAASGGAAARSSTQVIHIHRRPPP